jgi:SAM-dependent methyltransferase
MTELVKALRFRASRRAWERLAEQDPLWAVLSAPGKEGRRWDPTAFFATGEADVEDALTRLDVLGVPLRRDVALDFGCGVGRLSRALAERFERVLGVDLSGQMVTEARRLNADRPNMLFEHVDTRRLPTVASGSIDFVYSRLVLQHIQPALALEYVEDYFRVLTVGGVAMFSAPAIDPRPRFLGLRPLFRAVRELVSPTPRMSVSAIPRRDVEAAIARGGGLLVAAIDDEAPEGWPGYLYVATRPGRTAVA